MSYRWSSNQTSYLNVHCIELFSSKFKPAFIGTSSSINLSFTFPYLYQLFSNTSNSGKLTPYSSYWNLRGKIKQSLGLGVMIFLNNSISHRYELSDIFQLVKYRITTPHRHGIYFTITSIFRCYPSSFCITYTSNRYQNLTTRNTLNLLAYFSPRLVPISENTPRLCYGADGSPKVWAPNPFASPATLNRLGRGVFFSIPCPCPCSRACLTHSPDWFRLKIGGHKWSPSRQ